MGNNEDKFLNTLSKNPELLNELDKVNPGLKNQISGYVLSKWLPNGVGRKIIMLALLLLGIYGLFFGSHWFLISWAIIPIFSPRIVGEVATFFGRIS